MFPSVRVKVKGLEPLQQYYIAIDVVPVDSKRYRYGEFQWWLRRWTLLHGQMVNSCAGCGGNGGMDGWMDGWRYEWTDGWVGGGWMAIPMYGWM